MGVIESTANTTGSGLGTPFRTAGAPTTTSFLGPAVVGSRLIDTTNGVLYIATAVSAGVSVTWAKVGTQT